MKIRFAMAAICAAALTLSACGGESAAPEQSGNTDGAPAALSPAEQVKAREKNMKVIAKANKELREMAEGKTAFDAAKMQESAAALNSAAATGWEHFDAATKDEKSDALPAVWEQNEQFQQEIQTFQTAAAALNQAAAGGQLDAVKDPLGKVGESCKSCHTAFKQPH